MHAPRAKSNPLTPFNSRGVLNVAHAAGKWRRRSTARVAGISGARYDLSYGLPVAAFDVLFATPTSLRVVQGIFGRH